MSDGHANTAPAQGPVRCRWLGDAQTILKCYQQPDEDLIREALDARGKPDIAPNRQDD